MMKRGALIVFEGCDRSGKTTQCQRLMDWLKQSDRLAHFIRFPDRTTKIGVMISQYLECKSEMDDHAVHLLFSANRWEMMADMKKMLLEGTNLIVDRYAYSGSAFSAAKPGMDLRWCQQSDVGILRPDVVIFLDIDPTTAQSRGQYGAERYENLAMQNNVRLNYLKLKDDTWKVIDASQSPEQVHSEVCCVVQETWGKITNQSAVKQLWITEQL